MIPLTISIENCNELLSDARRRILASEARKFADAGIPKRTRWRWPVVYWDCIVKEHEMIFWHDTYYKRLARLRRMKERPKETT